MRTMVTLDPDVEVLVKGAMRERDASFKQVLNDALRHGLGKRSAAAAVRFQPLIFDMGPLLVASKNLNALAEELEDRELLAKLSRHR